MSENEAESSAETTEIFTEDQEVAQEEETLELIADNGETYKVKLGRHLATGCDAFPDADHTWCRQINGRPCGWHCPHCGAPTGDQGHRQCPELND